MEDSSKTVLVTPKFSVLERRIAAAGDGSENIRHVIEHPGAVAIIPLLEDNHVCLIQNERVAVGKTLIEVPAGTLEPAEPPLKTAERELKEETGYTAGHWHELSGFFMSPGILNERMHLFVAKALKPGPPAREQDEAIENLVVSWDEAMSMVLRGEIEDAKSIAALLLWDRLREIS